MSMDVEYAVNCRHSVRRYTDRKIDGLVLEEMKELIRACNEESGLNIQLMIDEPDAFSGLKAHYGKFSGVNNYVAMIGEKSKDLDEKIGYYGEKIVIKAATLGLNTCWVALTFSKRKSKCIVDKNENFVCAICIGYGETQGVPHTSRPMSSVCNTEGVIPEWFRKGMEFVLLAPTAINQQKFMFEQNGNNVSAKATGGLYSEVDLGIVKYHFELGAGKENFNWI